MKKHLILLALFVCISFFTAFAQNDTIEAPYDVSDTLQANFGLFDNDEILNISLRFDITEYRRKKPKDEYLTGLLTYHITEKDSVNKAVRIKSRGNMRNEYCNFPPIRLNFKNTDFEKEDLKSLDKVKMVTHCNSGNETYLFKEYLCYKLYNLLTDFSFKVRLLKIQYINTHKESKPINTYAFIIEPIEFLAKRMEGYPVNSPNIAQANILPEKIDRMTIFNYMIGNTDWTVPRQHNTKVLSLPKSENPSLGVVVPYDFDYSGLVDASYAIPDPNLRIKTVRERYYMGKCRSDEVYTKELKEFSDKKDEMFKVINDFPLLNDKVKKEMINYLNQFYDEFDKNNTIISNLKRTCID